MSECSRCHRIQKIVRKVGSVLAACVFCGAMMLSGEPETIGKLTIEAQLAAQNNVAYSVSSASSSMGWDVSTFYLTRGSSSS
jgi:hypothetical protein